jgi:hypothetical protein
VPRVLEQLERREAPVGIVVPPIVIPPIVYPVFTGGPLLITTQGGVIQDISDDRIR